MPTITIKSHRIMNTVGLSPTYNNLYLSIQSEIIPRIKKFFERNPDVCLILTEEVSYLYGGQYGETKLPMSSIEKYCLFGELDIYFPTESQLVEFKLIL